jgi:hypothetical protein
MCTFRTTPRQFSTGKSKGNSRDLQGRNEGKSTGLQANYRKTKDFQQEMIGKTLGFPRDLQRENIRIYNSDLQGRFRTREIYKADLTRQKLTGKTG